LERERIHFTSNKPRLQNNREPTDTDDMLSLLRQCIRYGCEYGVPYAVITDFGHYLILETPKDLLLDLGTKRYPASEPVRQQFVFWRLCKRHEGINKFVNQVE